MDFASQLLHWFHHQGRKHLPWQESINPYRVWVSEIMLQQTQVMTVIPYYERFMQRFPTLIDLAQAPLTEVLNLWAGLGYYARARNLHKAAVIICEQFAGLFPRDPDTLMSLPGIGKSTAHAILAISFGQKLAILDGNVKRVLTRFKGVRDYPGLPKVEQTLWAHAKQLLPDTDLPAYTQAIMDLGALICTKNKPSCLLCPVQANCYAFQHRCTETIPAPKPKRHYPIKKQICLILYQPNARKLFLEIRPLQGIWGGLHVPLFFDTEEALLLWQQQLQLSFMHSHVLPERSHKFTHFQLDFTPWLVSIQEFTYPSLHAYSLQQLAELALPAPIKSLLEEIKPDLIKLPCS